MNWKFNKDGWTDWIEHDGKGCPCVGWYVQTITFDGVLTELIAGSWCFRDGVDPHGEESAWVYGVEVHPSCVRKYRVRRPLGMSLLQQITQDKPLTLEPA